MSIIYACTTTIKRLPGPLILYLKRLLEKTIVSMYAHQEVSADTFPAVGALSWLLFTFGRTIQLQGR